MQKLTLASWRAISESYQLETAMWIGATLEQGVWYETSAPPYARQERVDWYAGLGKEPSETILQTDHIRTTWSYAAH